MQRSSSVLVINLPKCIRHPLLTPVCGCVKLNFAPNLVQLVDVVLRTGKNRLCRSRAGRPRNAKLLHQPQRRVAYSQCSWCVRQSSSEYDPFWPHRLVLTCVLYVGVTWRVATCRHVPAISYAWCQQAQTGRLERRRLQRSGVTIYARRGSLIQRG